MKMLENNTKEKRKVHRKRAKAKSKFIQVKQIIEEAQFLDKGFFFPYQLDFRGRIYPKATLLHHKVLIMQEH